MPLPIHNALQDGKPLSIISMNAPISNYFNQKSINSKINNNETF